MSSRIMKCASLMDREGKLHIDKITYPKLASPKFDGNRCYIEDGQAKSSSGKPIRNEFIRSTLSIAELNGLDGELIVGSTTAPDVRRVTSSGVSRKDGDPDFRLFVFDVLSMPNYAFFERLSVARDICIDQYEFCRISYVPHVRVDNLEQVLLYEQQQLNAGYEGVILRDPNAPYKQGRSTLKQNWALKLKRFVDAEAEIIGCYEREHNDNEATTDEHGYTKRSSHSANKRGAGDLGGFIVRDLKTRVEFSVGTGFTAEQRRQYWADQAHIIGSIITYKHFPVGAKDKPNLPSFVAFRDAEDMS